jgi:NhaP-type Na+/H+ or K+/H+ antiporter
VLLLVFAVVLVVAVLLSGLAHRTILSTGVLFLLAGFVAGEGVTGVVSVGADGDFVSRLAELALFAVLFTDGMRVGWQDLRFAWRLPGRALALGMPLTLVITAALAHWLVALGWAESLLLGAVLSPTDPVFASALVGNEKVPYRLRHLLNVESGVNDGLALPFVIVLLALAARSEDFHLAHLATELGSGIAIGIAVPLAVIRLERSRLFGTSESYQPLNGVAIGVLVFALAEATGGNLFLAGFCAGITVATFGPQQRASFHGFGEVVAELLKLAAVLVFGILLTPQMLSQVSVTGWVFAVLALVVARPVALGVSFLGSGLSLREQAAAAWFGPKGFASVVYGLYVLNTHIPTAEQGFRIVALTIALSMVAHSSTDVLVARWFDERREVPRWQ